MEKINPPDIKALINIIKTGEREEVKIAQKAIDSAWHNFYIPYHIEGRIAFKVFLDEIKTFNEIKDIDHQAYFINSLKWLFWTIGEEYFETWAEFILKYIQHPSGKIRQAIINACDYLIIDISDRDLNEKDEATLIRELINHKRFGKFVMDVEDLLQRYDKPQYKRYKYVSSMPVSIYKSLQILITEKLLRSKYYENLYDEYLHNLEISKLKSYQLN